MRKTKTGLPSTSRVALLEIGTAFTKEILDYRKYQKLLSTYIKPIKESLDENGRLHGMFSQGVTVTGRFSSSKPNLQNIPSHGKEGDAVRSLFIASPGHKLIVADYSQIELRFIAAYSQDLMLTQGFKNGTDLHSLTAKTILGIESPNAEQRFIGKTLNFSISYGATEYSLRDTLIKEEVAYIPTLDECAQYIKDFYSLYQGILPWKDREISKARYYKGVTTLYGRFIPLENTDTKNKWQAAQLGRFVVSYLVQGTAADIIRKAIILIAEQVKGIRFLNTVHDELIYEVAEEHAEDYRLIIKDIMENVGNLGFLVANVSICNNWGEK